MTLELLYYSEPEVIHIVDMSRKGDDELIVKSSLGQIVKPQE